MSIFITSTTDYVCLQLLLLGVQTPQTTSSNFNVGWICLCFHKLSKGFTSLSVYRAGFALHGASDAFLIFSSEAAQIGNATWMCKQEKKRNNLDVVRLESGLQYDWIWCLDIPWQCKSLWIYCIIENADRGCVRPSSLISPPENANCFIGLYSAHALQNVWWTYCFTRTDFILLFQNITSSWLYLGHIMLVGVLFKCIPGTIWAKNSTTKLLLCKPRKMLWRAVTLIMLLFLSASCCSHQACSGPAAGCFSLPVQNVLHFCCPVPAYYIFPGWYPYRL